MGIAVEIRVLTSPSAMEPMPMGEFERLPSTSSASGSVPMPPRYTLPLDVLISKTSYYSFITLAQLLRLNLGQKLVTFENTSCMFNTRNCAPDNVVGIVTIDFLLGDQQATHDFLVVREAGAPGLLGQSFIDAEDRELVLTFDTDSNSWALQWIRKAASRKSSLEGGEESPTPPAEVPPLVMLKAMEINNAVPIPNIFPYELSRDSSLSSQSNFPFNSDAATSPREEHQNSTLGNSSQGANSDSAAGESPGLTRSTSKMSMTSPKLQMRDNYCSSSFDEPMVLPQLHSPRNKRGAPPESRGLFPSPLQSQSLYSNCGFGPLSPSMLPEPQLPHTACDYNTSLLPPLFPKAGRFQPNPPVPQSPVNTQSPLQNVELLRRLLETVARGQDQQQQQQQHILLREALKKKQDQMVERRMLQYLQEEEAKQQFHMPHRMQQSQPTNSYPFNTGLSASWPGKTTNLGFVFDRQQSQDDIFARQNLANQRHLSNVLQEVLQSRRN